MVVDRIEREVVIAASADRVWAALTEAAHLGEWFGDAGAEVDLRPGGRMTFRWHRYGSARAVVERVEPPRRFSYRWALRSDVDPEPGNSTLVEFTLEEEASGVTRLRVVESGFASLAWSEEERARDARDNTSGWASELAELVKYVEERQAA